MEYRLTKAEIYNFNKSKKLIFIKLTVTFIFKTKKPRFKPWAIAIIITLKKVPALNPQLHLSQSPILRKHAPNHR